MVSLIDRARPILTATASRVFSDGTERISVVIRLWDKNGRSPMRDTCFTIKSNSPLKNILRIYSVREAIHPSCLGYFRFLVGPRELHGDESAIEVGLCDGDCIDAIPCLDDIVGGRFV